VDFSLQRCKLGLFRRTGAISARSPT